MQELRRVRCLRLDSFSTPCRNFGRAHLAERSPMPRSIRTLVPRQDLTGTDRTWAERYEVGAVLRYSRTSKETGIGKGA
jgi:hypothetical protein